MQLPDAASMQLPSRASLIKRFFSFFLPAFIDLKRNKKKVYDVKFKKAVNRTFTQQFHKKFTSKTHANTKSGN